MCKKLADGVYRYCPSRQRGARSAAKKAARKNVDHQATDMASALPATDSTRIARETPDDLRAAGQKWIDSLDWGLCSTLKQYTGSDYIPINSTLKKNHGVLSPDDPAAGIIRDLDKALAACPKADEPHIVYRGVRPWGSNAEGKSGSQWAQDTFPVGENIIFPAFSSTSPDYRSTDSFTLSGDNNRVVFEIATRQQGYVASISKYQSEQELLLRRNTRFRVVSVTPKAQIDNGYSKERATIVQLVEVEDPDDQTTTD